MDRTERRADCLAHKQITDDLKKAIFGNGRAGLKEKVVKLEVLIWIVITLLLGNGGLLAYTFMTISNLKK